MSYFDNPKKQYSEDKILNPPEHVRYEIKIILDILKFKRINQVIDFGAGTGRLTIPLLRNNIKTTAVDISKESLKKLINLAKKIKKNRYLKTANSLSKEKTNVIVGADILHHINIKKYFNLFKKKINKNGIIIFSEPNFLNPSWLFFITLFLDWREEKRIIFCTSINLINQLKKNGFKNIRLIGLGLLPTIFFNRLPLLAKINYFLGKLPLLKFFAYRIILQAEK